MGYLGKYLGTNIDIRCLSWIFLFFVIPVFPILISPVVILICILSFYDFKKLKIQDVNSPTLLISILIFFTYLFGLFFTDSGINKFEFVERKLSFLVFPLLFIFYPGFIGEIKRILWWSFLSGLILYTCISFISSLVSYIKSGEIESFFSSSFSFAIHPSYSSLYLCVAISYLIFQIINGSNGTLKISKKIIIFLILVFTIDVFLLSSKAGIISFLLIILIYVVYFFVITKKIKFILLFSFALVLICSCFFVYDVKPVQRFKNMFSASSLSNEDLFRLHHNSTESNIVRRMIWIVSSDLIKENPWGVGSGDVKSALISKYKQRNMQGAIQKEFNAHNQFLQVTLELGFPGLLLFLIFLFFPLYHALKNRRIVLISFSLIIIFNLFVESMIEAESGIVFICLFYCFLFGEKKKIANFKYSNI